MTPYTFLQDLNQNLSPGGTVVFNDESTKVVRFSFAQGAGLPTHKTTFPALIQILSGTANIELGESKHIAQPGSFIRMEPNLPHSVIATEDLVFLLILLKGRYTDPASGAPG